MSKRNTTAMHSHDTINSNNSEPTPHMHKIYYKNEFSKAYKTELLPLLQIMKNYTMCNNHGEQLKILIYYKSNNIYSLLTNNNHSKKIDPLKTINAICKFKCTTGNCEHQDSFFLYWHDHHNHVQEAHNALSLGCQQKPHGNQP